MVILGIDPGTAITGYGVIKIIKKRKKTKQKNNKWESSKYKVIEYGVIKTHPFFSSGERLKKIYNDVSKLIKKYKPKILAIENLYFFKNSKTALPVSQAKGVIILIAAKKKIPIYEITPLQVKMAIAGYGKAEKKQIQKMIKVLLNLKEIPRPDDAADALAIALCGALLSKKSSS